MKLSITTLCIECHYAECHELYIVMLNDIMLNNVMMNAVMLNVVVLSDAVLSQLFSGSTQSLTQAHSCFPLRSLESELEAVY
jgi:hypothetical protein